MKNKHLLILGRSGTGKTFLTKKLIRSGAFGNRVIIVDPEGEHDDLAGFKTLTIDELLEELRTPKNFFHYHVELLDDDSIIDDVTDVVDIANEVQNLTLVFEEISDYSTCSAVRTIYRKGRKRGIQCVGISQRTPEVHKTVTSQSRTLVLFHTDEPNDLNTIRKRFGTKTMLEVQNLNPEKYERIVQGDPELMRKIVKV